MSPEHEAAPTSADELADDLVAAYRRELWSVVPLEDPEVLDELRSVARRVAAALSPAISEHRLLTDTELAVVRRLDALPFARRLARHDLLRLHHVAPKALFRRLTTPPPRDIPDARDRIEHYRRASAAVLGITSQIRTSLFESTLPPATTEAADRTTGPMTAVLEELVSGWSDAPEATRKRALAAGFVLGPAHAVGAVDADSPELLRDIARKTAHALDEGPYRPLTDLYDGRAVIVLPVKARDQGPALPSILEEVIHTDGVRAGVGRLQPELPGIRTSYEQSLRVLALLREAPALGPTMAFDDALPYLALRADPGLSLEVQSVVEPLVVYDQAEGTDLLGTLGAVLDNPGNLTDVSRTLHIHRHTLYNRAERIEKLTGRRLGHPDDRLLLELAVRASRLLP